VDYLTCSDVADSLNSQGNLSLPYTLPTIQVAATNLGATFASYPFLEAMMNAISDAIQQRDPNIRTRSPLNNVNVTEGSNGINAYISAKTGFVQPSLLLYTHLQVSCSSRANLFTKKGYQLAASLFWAAPALSDPFTIDFRVLTGSRKPAGQINSKEMLHVHCQTDGLPKLTCTSALTEEMRQIYSENSLSKTPREEEFRLLDKSEKERPIDLIFIRTLIANVLDDLKDESPVKS